MNHIQRVLLSLAVAAAGLAGSASAQPAPDTAASGLRLSGQYCITCHVVVPSKERGWTDAPSFAEIANRPGVTVATLSAVVQQPHMNMLNGQRPKDEADAIATYIVSLRKR